MSNLVLHHYPQSPFAEKARLMLGLKSLAWRSVMIPRVMPKPDLVALTGGYRRTPVLQVGADIWCDTALIARRLEREQPVSPLFPAGREGAAAMLAQFADQVLFGHAVALNFHPEALAARFAGVPEAHVRAFADDRRALFGNGNATRLPHDVARSQWPTHLGRLERQLSDAAFLLGDTPCLADIACYHPIWFVEGNPSLTDLLDPFPRLRGWMERVAAIGHGSPTPFGAGDAIAEAAAREPDACADNGYVDANGFAAGQHVSVAATDYGADPVTGMLAWHDVEEIVIAREDERAGRLHVHFPRIGFRMAQA